MNTEKQTGFFPYLDPEDSQLELKSCTKGSLPDDIWKTISAFSNAEGENRHRKYLLSDKYNA